MQQRTGNSDVALAVSPEAARGRLDEQLATGSKLAAADCFTGELEDNFYAWDERNFALLREIFTTAVNAERYAAAAAVVDIGYPAFYDNEALFWENLRRKLKRLQEIRDQL